MASWTFSGPWFDGDTVGAYDALSWPGTGPERGQAPSASPVLTATVSAGAVTFHGLAQDHAYYLGGQTAGQWRYVFARTQNLHRSATLTGDTSDDDEAISAGTGVLLGVDTVAVSIDVPDSTDISDSGDSVRVNAAVAEANALLDRGAPGVRIVAQPGCVYSCGITQSLAALNPSGSTPSYDTCFSGLRSRMEFDGAGSTFQRRGTAQSVLFQNASADGSARDANITIRNVVLDGNAAATTSYALLRLAYIDGLTLDHVHVTNGINVGAFLFAVTDFDFDHLRGDSFQGQPWQFGDPQTANNGDGAATGDNLMYDGHIGRIESRNVTALNGASQPGNPLAGLFQRSAIDEIVSRNCAAGIKIEYPSEFLTIGKVLMYGQNDNHLGTRINSGLKLQGDIATNRYVKRVAVGLVVVEGQFGAGLYMTNTRSCSIERYVGYGNGIDGTVPDVWLEGADDEIGSIDSEGAGIDGVSFKPTAANVHVKRARVKNAGQASGANTAKGIRVEGGATGAIDSATVDDDQGTATTKYGLWDAAGGKVTVGRFQSTIANKGAGAAEEFHGSTDVRTERAASGPPYVSRVVLAIEPAAYVAPGPAYGKITPSGQYLGPDVATLAADKQIAQGIPFAMPLPLQGQAFDEIGVDCTTVGEAGALVRLVVWNDNGHGVPGTVALDAGTVAVGAGDGTGYKSIVIAHTFATGNYHVGGIPQACATTPAKFEGTGGFVFPTPLGTTVGLSATSLTYSGVVGTDQGATGAAAAFSSPGATGGIPRVVLRAA